MTTNRKKLVKLLGSAQLRDFASSEEMEKAKALQELMASNDNAPVKKRRKKESKEIAPLTVG